mgnify:CR=1 FL=1
MWEVEGAALAASPSPSTKPCGATFRPTLRTQTVPAPAPTSETFSLVLRLTGSGLVPWSKSKGDKVLASLVPFLQGRALVVSGTQLVLLQALAPASGRRRLAGRDSAGAAIPSLYAVSQTVDVQVSEGAAGVQARQGQAPLCAASMLPAGVERLYSR